RRPRVRGPGGAAPALVHGSGGAGVMTLVLRHASQVVGVSPSGLHARTGAALRDPGLIADGAVVVEGDRIAWVGPTADLPALPAGGEVVDVPGQVVTPGLVDGHTHLVFAGDRVTT